jgi:hypothetical protein
VLRNDKVYVPEARRTHRIDALGRRSSSKGVRFGDCALLYESKFAVVLTLGLAPAIPFSRVLLLYGSYNCAGDNKRKYDICGFRHTDNRCANGSQGDTNDEAFRQ